MKLETIYKVVVLMLVTNHKNSYFSLIRNRFKTTIYTFLINRYPQLNSHPLSEYCYWFIHGITAFPICRRIDRYGHICNNQCKFMNISKGYTEYCSLLCMQMSVFTEQARVKTNLEKTGFAHQQSCQVVKDKIQATRRKHIEENPLYLANIKDKSNQTIQAHIDEDPLYWKHIQEKRERTNLKNGNSATWNNRQKFKETVSNFTDDRRKEIQEKKAATTSKHLELNPKFWKDRAQKTRQTKKAKYGSETWQNIEKTRQTKQDKYGDPTYHNIEQSKQSCKAKYGVEYYFQSIEFAKSRSKKVKSDEYQIEFDSKWELIVYDYCKHHNLEVEYQPNVRFEFMFDGLIFGYQPDFMINGKLYEVKGDHFFKDKDPSKEMICPYRKKDWTDERYAWECQKYEEKHQCMLVNKVKIITQKDLTKLDSIFV